MRKITQLFAPWIFLFTFAAVGLAFYGAHAAPPMPDAPALDVNVTIDAITEAAHGYEHAESAAAKHMAIAALLAVVFRVLLQLGKRLLDVAREAIADSALVPAGPTWALLDELLDEGFTRTDIARRLGSKAKRPELQISRAHVEAATAARVERLHRKLTR
jgi:hypothetical protein